MSTPNLPEDTTTVLTAVQAFYPKAAAYMKWGLGWFFTVGGLSLASGAVLTDLGHALQHPFDGTQWKIVAGSLTVAGLAFSNTLHPKAQMLLSNTVSAMPHATAQPGAGLVVEKVK